MNVLTVITTIITAWSSLRSAEKHGRMEQSQPEEEEEEEEV